MVAVTWALGFSLFRSTGRAVGSVHAAQIPVPAALGGKGLPVACWGSERAS